MTEWRWANFSENEVRCKDGSLVVVPEFMDKMQRLREDYGKPMIVTSWYRSPKYNSMVSTTGKFGPHTTGRAVDINVYGKDAYDLLHLALLHGFTGVGLKQNGPLESRFIHLDDLTEGTRPWIWSYP